MAQLDGGAVMVARIWLLFMALSLTACSPGDLLQMGAVRERFLPGAQSPTPPNFRTIVEVPLTGGPSRFDYQSLDPRTHRLYIAHLGASLVTVFDTQTGTIVGDVLGVPGVHGVLAVPDLGRVYASATDINQVAVIDTSTLAVVATIPTDEFPDGLAYAPEAGKVYVSNQRGASDTVIDVRTNQVVATVPLGGEVGNTQYDPASRRIYAAVHGRNQLVAIDPSTDQVTDRHDLPGCVDPHGLYIAAARQAAFVGCEGNAKLLIVDMRTMRVTSEHPVGQSPDVLAFDDALGRLYVAAEDGVLTVLALDESGVRQIARGFAGPNAHSVAVNPDTHHIYLPLMDVGGGPVLRVMAVEASGPE
jgi:YVTN family beta-propeller protein